MDLADFWVDIPHPQSTAGVSGQRGQRFLRGGGGGGGGSGGRLVVEGVGWSEGGVSGDVRQHPRSRRHERLGIVENPALHRLLFVTFTHGAQRALRRR